MSGLSRRAPAAAYFFCVLAACAMLRPVRDEIATRHVAHLPWLFSASLAATLVVFPGAAAAAARIPRGRLLPALSAFLAADLVVFRAAWRVPGAASWLEPALFLWWNVFSLLAVSISWSVMTELFARRGEAEHAFGFVAAGGSAGTLVGPAIAAALSRRVGPDGIVLGGAALFAAAAIVSARWGGATRATIGVGPWKALSGAVRSAFFRRISLSTVCYTAISTFAYFFQAESIGRAIASPRLRTERLAEIDLAVNAIAIVLQITAAGPLLRRYGAARTLAISSALVALSLAAVAVAPGLAAVVALQIVHRAGHFAIGRPAREALFVPFDPPFRFHAKNFVDTAVSRSTDAASAWTVSVLRTAGLGIAGAAAIAIPIALLWTATNRSLAREAR